MSTGQSMIESRIYAASADNQVVLSSDASRHYCLAHEPARPFRRSARQCGGLFSPWFLFLFFFFFPRDGVSNTGIYLFFLAPVVFGRS